MSSKVLSLDQLSCPQIWNIGQEKDREKEKVGDRPAKLNDKKSSMELEREIRSHLLLEERHENFVAAVTKWEILAATKVKMSGSKKKLKKKKKHVRHSLHKTRN